MSEQMFIADTADVSKSDSENKVLFEDKPLPIDDALAGIPEVAACVELLRETMRQLRTRRDITPFIRKQKQKALQLDFLKLGGRLKALSKLLKALDEHPDYYEVQEDVKDCAEALALLVQSLARKHKLDIGAWCREHFPLTPEQARERDAYEEALLAKVAASMDMETDAGTGTISAVSDNIDPGMLSLVGVDCGDEGILTSLPDCGDTGIFGCGDAPTDTDTDTTAEPTADQSNDPIDLDA